MLLRVHGGEVLVEAVVLAGRRQVVAGPGLARPRRAARRGGTHCRAKGGGRRLHIIL